MKVHFPRLRRVNKEGRQAADIEVLEETYGRAKTDYEAYRQRALAETQEGCDLSPAYKQETEVHPPSHIKGKLLSASFI
jgi:hypothetical protein